MTIERTQFVKMMNGSSDASNVVSDVVSLSVVKLSKLGEFLKELNLTEGRATGIPTIQDELKANGSPRATIETDEERTYFLIDIPCHPEFVGKTLSVEQIGVKEQNVTKDVTKDVTKELIERQLVIMKIVIEDSFVTIPEMSLKTGVATRTIKRDMESLQASGILARKGGRKDGEWIVTELGLAVLVSCARRVWR